MSENARYANLAHFLGSIAESYEWYLAACDFVGGMDYVGRPLTEAKEQDIQRFLTSLHEWAAWVENLDGPLAQQVAAMPRDLLVSDEEFWHELIWLASGRLFDGTIPELPLGKCRMVSTDDMVPLTEAALSLAQEVATHEKEMA